VAAVSTVGLVAGLVGALAIPAGAARPRGPTGDPIIIGAEQEPDCADWIASCAGASWGVWTMMEHTMPRAFDFVRQGNKYVYEPNVMLADEPKLETVDGQQTVTYEISEDAVWSDGEPITSHDFQYTWDQIVTGEDIYDPTGYNKIESVDDTDPSIAVVTFAEPYAPWRALFGGGLYGILPSHLLEGNDRSALMANGYSFSGGPYIATWERGVSVTLDANPNWYGEPVKTQQIVFQFLPDTAAQFQAFKAGEVDAIYPQPQPDVIEQINAGIEDANSYFTTVTPNAEALWINNEAFPFDSVKVRQAFAYSIDRDVVVDRLFGDLGVNEALNTLNPPVNAAFADTKAFSKYTLNLKKVNSLMTSDGWEKNADGIWEKDGEAADIVIQSTEGNQRRALTEEILQELLGEAGFNLTIENHSAGDLFGQNLPAGDYQVGLYAQVATQIEPGNCAIFCSQNIPTDANGNVGQNWTRTDLPGLDDLLSIVDTSDDPAEVARANKKADKILARFVTSLPLDPLPNISIWSTSIKGIDKKHPDNPFFALFFNLAEWEKA
jgi:peptide/nickel transport system substrate-binding protein